MLSSSAPPRRDKADARRTSQDDDDDDDDDEEEELMRRGESDGSWAKESRIKYRWATMIEKQWMKYGYFKIFGTELSWYRYTSTYIGGTVERSGILHDFIRLVLNPDVQKMAVIQFQTQFLLPFGKCQQPILVLSCSSIDPCNFDQIVSHLREAGGGFDMAFLWWIKNQGRILNQRYFILSRGTK
jgi:hypothetical protein